MQLDTSDQVVPLISIDHLCGEFMVNDSCVLMLMFDKCYYLIIKWFIR